jgi:uncharacterized protein YbjQ (UPF0145 family)
MIISTTPTIEGHKIARYAGIVSGEAIIGANVISDFFARVRDIVGGRAGAYESKLVDAREIALQDMEAAAAKLGANAVVGVDLDYEVLGQDNGMLMVTVSGTAVVLEASR